VVLARRSLGATIAAQRKAPVPAEPETVAAVADHSLPFEVAALVESLPTDQRQAFVLTQVLGFDYATAAETLDVPIGTIRSRVFRARDALVRAWTDADTNPATDARQRRERQVATQEADQGGRVPEERGLREVPS